MTDQNEGGCWQTPEQLSQNRKQNNRKQQYWSDVKTRGCLSSQTVIWLFVGVWQAVIPHLKEDIHVYLLIYKFDFLTN